MTALRQAVAGLFWLAAAPVFAHGNHSPYNAPGEVWTLIELDGNPFKARLLLEFPEIGQVQGSGPCNRFHAEMWAAYPWFRLEAIAATRRACPEMAEEAEAFEALAAMTQAESDGEVLILTDDDHRSMVFRPSRYGD